MRKLGRTILAIIFLSFAIASSALAAPAYGEWIYNSDTGDWYSWTTPGTWHETHAEALAMGGDLVSIHSAAENMWIFDNFTYHSPQSRYGCWMGFTDEGDEGNWRWTDGTAVNYTNWFTDQPDNAHGGGEQFGQMVGPGSAQASLWNDLRANEPDLGTLGMPGLVKLSNTWSSQETEAPQHGNVTQDFDPTKPTVIITHGINTSATDVQEGWLKQMADAIETKNPDCNVVILDWSECSSVSGIEYVNPLTWSRGSAKWIDYGYYFASQFAELAGEDYDLPIHLIGHSAGGHVMSAVSRGLDERDYDVDQVTLLDPSPTVGFYYPEADFIDHYATTILGFAGMRDGYNVDLTEEADYPSDFLSQHAFAYEWYMDTIENQETNGFYWSLMAPWRTSEDRPEMGNGLVLPRVQQVAIDTFENWDEWAGQNDVVVMYGVCCLTESSPAYLYKWLAISEDVNALSFDFRFVELGDGDFLTLHFGDQLLFIFEGSAFPGEDFMNSGLLDISEFSGQAGWLTFALNSEGDANCQIEIDNFEMLSVSTVPEAGTVAMFAAGAMGVLGVVRRRFA